MITLRDIRSQDGNGNFFQKTVSSDKNILFFCGWFFRRADGDFLYGPRLVQGVEGVSQIGKNAVYLGQIFLKEKFYYMEVEKMFGVQGLSLKIGNLGVTAKRMTALMAVFCLFGASHPVSAEAGEKITINLASRILTFWRNGQKVSMYPIAVGKLETQTPLGDFCVLEKEVDPVWVDPKDEKKRVESGEDNPLGYRWMGIGGHYGIHGTNRPDSIGEYVSNGCIRLWEENAEELYEMTDIGTPVEIDYERLVIERLADGRIAYYIYPDGYYCQYLDVASVKEGLAAFGVADFVSDADVAEKIAASDGEPTFLPDTLRIEINDLWVSGRALKRNRKIYIPVAPASALTKLPVTSNWDTMTLSTVNGAAQGEVFNGKWYFVLDDAQKLFGLSGAVEKDGVLRLRNASQVSVQEQTGQNAAVKDQSVQDKAANDQPVQDQAAKDQPVQDKAVKDQPAQDKVGKEQVARENVVKEQAVQKTAEREPIVRPATLPDTPAKG